MLAIIGLVGGLVGALLVAKKFLRGDFNKNYSDITEKEWVAAESDGE